MQKFTPNMITTEMKEAAKNIFMAMAWIETIKPVVEGYQRKVLESHQWPIAKEWSERVKGDTRIILEPKESYLLEDSDAEIYFEEINREREKAGLKVEDPGNCPLLVAKHDLTKAEWALIEAMEPITGIKEIPIMEHREKFLDLTLRLLAPFVDN